MKKVCGNGALAFILNLTPGTTLCEPVCFCLLLCCLFSLVTFFFYIVMNPVTFSSVEFFIGAHTTRMRIEEVLIVKDSRYEESNRYNAKDTKTFFSV